MKTSNDQKRKARKKKNDTALLTIYKPLSYMAVQQEVTTLREISNAINEEWQQEVSMYEETIYQGSSSQVVEVPRRNYRNDDKHVTDTKLYPYHTACYPLLCIYDQELSVIYSRFPGHLPCSDGAINTSITGLAMAETPRYLENIHAMLLEEEWTNGFEARLKSQEDPTHWLGHETIDIEFGCDSTYGLANFPAEADARADILVKLLRHSMSDLQKDHNLAAAVIVRMARWKLFQKVHHLRNVLSIIETERKGCDGRCYDGYLDDEQEIPDHDCASWKLFESTIPCMLFAGVEYFTSEHSLAIAGITQLYFDQVNPAAAELESSMVEEAVNPKPRLEGGDKCKRRAMLKQKLYISQHTYYEDEDTDESDSDDDEEEDSTSELQESNWIDEIVVGLATHAVLARQRVIDCRDRLQQMTAQDDSYALTLLLLKSIDSFYNCARCLVYIGEASLRRLPNNPRVVGFCSRLVLCLTQLYLQPNLAFYDYNKVNKRTYLRAGKSLIDPNRYADSILAATEIYRQRHFSASSCGAEQEFSVLEPAREAIQAAESFLRESPDKDAQDLVWCLFTKDLVNTRISRCGYGDIHVWWGLPISPLDPLLFFYACNTPDDGLWEADEEERELSEERLYARYDFSLVLLLCAWHAPWNIERHHSFQEPFRDAVRTLFLCANRMHMPTDIMCQICVYLRRDWWPDERAQCFSEDCLEKQADKLLRQKLIRQVTGTSPKSKRASKSFTHCPSCSVASYCCEDHRQSDYKVEHRGACGNPPFKIPGQKEVELLNDILRLQESKLVLPVFNDHVQHLVESMLRTALDAGEDDSGSWISVDTDEREEEQQRESITDVVHGFFARKCLPGLLDWR